LRAAGLNAVAAGMSLPAALQAAQDFPAGAERVGHALGHVMTQRMARDLAPLRADLIVHDITTYGGALAARNAGIPAVCHTFGRVEPGEMWRAAIEVAGESAVSDLTVDICPPALQSPRFTAERLLLRPVAWSPPGASPKRTDRPLVYLTLGTAFATTEVLRRCVDGLAVLPVDVLVATGPASLDDVPDNVHVAAWVSQAEVLPVADLVVHHGGSGTTLGALTAGRPQLVLPQAADGFGNADAVVSAGAGIRLLPEELTSEAVAGHARALLADSAVHEAARRVAAGIAAMPSPDDVVAELTRTDWAGRPRPSSRG
jgi:UDP:flavonoid glycosyltransferase YjiC (YdhE family)